MILYAIQVIWLEAITREGVAKQALVGLDAKLNESLQEAIQAHNNGEADNSPIPRGFFIATGPFGPKETHGYKLVARDPLLEAAYDKLAPTPQSDTLIIKTCSCGAVYSPETWKQLKFVGHHTDDVEKLELRNCDCRSTIAVVVETYRSED